jgi:hypothetical protein
MSLPEEKLAWLPAEARTQPVGWRGLYGVLGGPVAWFLQLCIGDWLASAPCYPGSVRYLVPPSSLAWTWPTLIVLLTACALIAFVACLVSWRIWRESRVSPYALRGVGPPAARVRFLAFFGIVLGAGFCVATLLTAVAFATLPRCAG